MECKGDLGNKERESIRIETRHDCVQRGEGARRGQAAPFIQSKHTCWQVMEGQNIELMLTKSM